VPDLEIRANCLIYLSVPGRDIFACSKAVKTSMLGHGDRFVVSKRAKSGDSGSPLARLSAIRSFKTALE
jgi:hypothetical protein